MIWSFAFRLGVSILITVFFSRSFPLYLQMVHYFNLMQFLFFCSISFRRPPSKFSVSSLLLALCKPSGTCPLYFRIVEEKIVQVKICFNFQWCFFETFFKINLASFCLEFKFQLGKRYLTEVNKRTLYK